MLEYQHLDSKPSVLLHEGVFEGKSKKSLEYRIMRGLVVEKYWLLQPGHSREACEFMDQDFFQNELFIEAMPPVVLSIGEESE